jgi:hypothetical protein
VDATSANSSFSWSQAVVDGMNENKKDSWACGRRGCAL